MLQRRSTLNPAMFMNYSLKYGYQIKRLFLLLSFVETSMPAHYLKKAKSYETAPVTKLLRVLEYHFTLDPSLLTTETEFLQYVRKTD